MQWHHAALALSPNPASCRSVHLLSALQDFIDAVGEVDAGYITDDMVRERRGLQAAIMRRLEVEEWDKERMRHFYYGLYGLGPWYWDMEERLHNPFFIGARGWNGPPESWINENQVGTWAARGGGGACR